ncbi:MAG: radical SAM protein, partial [Dehalococcoidia bacterium]|nr:radical SAM protein [Dehalococcoidia bacterium]
MRILLVQPRQEHGVGFKRLSVVEPLAIETIAACLTKDHEVQILDLFTYPELRSTLDSFKPDLCGISCGFTIDVYKTLTIAREIRAALPKAKVVLGGHHPTMNPQDFYKNAVDYIVVGEGEETTPALAACLEKGGDPREVPGLILNLPEGQHSTGKRPGIKSLDDMPFPARHLTQRYRRDYYLTFWKPVATLESARGCPYRCNYCSVWKFYQGKCQTRSPEWTLEALRQIKEHYIMFTDDNFLLDVPRAKRIAALIKESGMKKKAYFFQARSDAIVRDPDVIAEWRSVGLENLFIGFEAIDDAVLASLNKRNAVENNEAA